MKYLVEVKMEVNAKSYNEAVVKVNNAIDFGLEESSFSTPPEGVTVTGTKVEVAPPTVVGNPVFEVTVVKSVAIHVSLSDAQDLLRELDEPADLESYENDPKGLVEIAISMAEGRNLDLCFDREIFVHLDSGSHVGT